MVDTFSPIHTFTVPPVFTPASSIVTDGIDIFFERAGVNRGEIWKYTTATNTSAKFVDRSQFAVGTTSSFSMVVFRANIYVGTFESASNPDPLNHVYRVNPSTGAVTEVLTDFPRSASTMPGGDGIDNESFKLYSTEDVLVAAYHERRNGASDPPEFLSRYTTNGTTWLIPTNTFSEKIEETNVVLIDEQSQGRDFRELGIYERYPVSGTSTVIVLKFVTNSWIKVRGPQTIIGDEITLFEVAADHFWNRDDFGQYTDDWSSYHQPVGTSGSILGLNMPYAVSQEFDATTIIKLDTADPFTTKETDSTMAEDGFAIGSQVDVMIRLNSGNTLLFMKAFGSTFPDWSIWQRSANLTATPNAWQGGHGFTPPKIPLPASIDADGTFIYIAAINTLDLPVLLKFNTNMLSNPEVVFQPGLGNDIGVICGRESANNIWIGGAFGTTDVVEKSEDAGDTFEVKDDGTFGTVEAFTIGPDSDDRVLIVTDDVDIEETIDSGAIWTNINTGIGFNVNAIARLAISLEEIIFGNDSGVTNNIDYSIDIGENFEDLTVAPFPAEDVKRIIVNG